MPVKDLLNLDPNKVIHLAALQGWVRIDVAREAGISQGTIAKVFNYRGISPRTAKKIADALGVTIEALIDEQAKSKKGVQSLMHEPVAASAP